MVRGRAEPLMPAEAGRSPEGWWCRYTERHKVRGAGAAAQAGRAAKAWTLRLCVRSRLTGRPNPARSGRSRRLRASMRLLADRAAKEGSPPNENGIHPPA